MNPIGLILMTLCCLPVFIAYGYVFYMLIQWQADLNERKNEMDIRIAKRLEETKHHKPATLK